MLFLDDHEPSLADLNKADEEAKRKYDDACEDYRCALQARADDPCEVTLQALRTAKHRMDRARRAREATREGFEEAWVSENAYY